jgi:hypothetical protein
MAWTAPRDWAAISAGIVTAASLNTDVRDNLGVLSTHTHTGGDVGQGASTLSGLTLAALVTLTFANQSANPDAAGELQRNGNDLLFYGSSAVNLTAADASAGTASLRTLGTTSVKAAAGNHTHVPAVQASGYTDGNESSGSYDDDDEHDIVSDTATPGATGRAWVIIGSVETPANTSIVFTARLYYDSTLLLTRTGLVGLSGDSRLYVMQSFQASPTAASHTVKLTTQRTSGSSSYIINGTIAFTEVSA